MSGNKMSKEDAARIQAANAQANNGQTPKDSFPARAQVLTIDCDSKHSEAHFEFWNFGAVLHCESFSVLAGSSQRLNRRLVYDAASA